GGEVHLFTSRLGDDTPSDVTALQLHLLPKLPSEDAALLERAALATNTFLQDALARESEQAPFDLIYERQSLWSYAGMEFAREHSIPSILEVNAPLIEEQVSCRMLIDQRSAEDAAMRAFRSATAITAVSRQLACLLEQHPSARGKVHIVPNAVNPERFGDIAPAIPRNGAFVIGYIGVLRARHGLNTLIESFTLMAHQSAKARLLIVGDGPDREYLDREIAARGLTERVQFTGAVPPELVPGYLASMDVALAPYPPLAHFYSSPLKLYEYMAAGLPIVATRIGQIEEVIRDGETGVLVRPGDASGMAQAVNRLELDAETRFRLGDAARQAVQDHTWDHVLDLSLSFSGLTAVET
ncbi:MAG TPA: glycosyltransferase family 4 protein, partial [Methylomirabilota bacterium]|nr:glycosyltransferase family 4 protein [Methylomirabilota bacterium]